MAPLSSAKRHPGPGRPPRNPPKQEPSEGPPLKKRKYVPGGPGGGGRFIEYEVKEVQSTKVVKPAKPAKPTPVRRTSSVSRSRTARETLRESGPQPVQDVPPPSARVPTTPPSARLRRDKTQNRGRFGSSTSAALALQQGDGYKPRECG
jgi:NuA3 HAT complex component NTO1